MGKVEQLTDHVKKLDEKLDNFIESSKESGAEGSTVESVRSKIKPNKDKQDRVEEEKLKQFKLLQERLSKVEESKSEHGESSEDEPGNLKALRKKMSRKQRDLC